MAVRRDGRRRYYSARKEALGPLASTFEALWRDRLAELKRLAEAEARRTP